MNQQSIVISHTSTDAAYAKALAAELRALGLKSFTAAGARSVAKMEKIREALTAAEWFVVLVSDRSLWSPWINFEFGAALGQGKRVLPVYLSAAAKRRSLHQFRHLKGVSVANSPPADAARKIARVIMSRDGDLRAQKRAS